MTRGRTMRGRARAAWLAAALVSTAAGCGLSHTIDRDLLDQISIEYKLTLFDAENDLSIALDERERVQREIYETRRDIADAEAQIVEAVSDAERAKKKNEKERVAVSRMAQEVFKLKIAYLEQQIDYLRDKLESQDNMIDVARARYELAKAKLVKKNNVRGAESVDLPAFEAQVDAYIQEARAGQKTLEASAKKVEQVKDVWLKRRDELSQASGGGVGSAWAEDGGVWGMQ